MLQRNVFSDHTMEWGDFVAMAQRSAYPSADPVVSLKLHNCECAHNFRIRQADCVPQLPTSTISMPSEIDLKVRVRTPLLVENIIRAQKHTIRRDYDLSNFWARLVQSDDFERFDLILAVEESNSLDLRTRCPAKFTDKQHCWTEYCQHQELRDLPDPWYGEPDDFEFVLDLVEDVSVDLLRSCV